MSEEQSKETLEQVRKLHETKKKNRKCRRSMKKKDGAMTKSDPLPMYIITIRTLSEELVG